MRHALILALTLAASPALAADDHPTDVARPAAKPAPKPEVAKPEPPPSPPPVVWEVWGFKWDGSQYVKQPAQCLKTTDLRRAADYSQDLLGTAGWMVSVNLPYNCYQHRVYHDPTVPHWAQYAVACPDVPVMDVWAFKLTDGKWVKSDEYSWSTKDYHQSDARYVALDLAKRISAVPGWCATTNAPDVPMPCPLKIDAGAVRGLPYAYGCYGCGGSVGTSRNGYPVYSEHGGRTIYRPHMTIRTGADADWHYRHTPHDEPRND